MGQQFYLSVSFLKDDMRLKALFDRWGAKAQQEYANKQWLLSKWEVQEGIEWAQEKTDCLVQSLCQGLRPTRQDRLIELGCGGGWILEQLSPHVRESYGLDFSMEMMKFAGSRLKGRLINGEIGSLPLASGSFDRILSYYVFMNFDSDEYVQCSLKEIVRVLKKGGCALIGQLPDQAKSQKYEEAKEAYRRYCQDHYKLGKSIREEYKPPLRLFSKEKFRQMLEGDNVKVSFQDSFNPFYYAGQPQSVDWRFDLIIHK